LEAALDTLGTWLVHTDVGLALLLVVGLSMSLSHVFALLANRLSGHQILIHLVLDGLMLSVAFLLSSTIDMVLLATYASVPVHPSAFINSIAICLLPAVFYLLVAAPYVGDVIGFAIWVLLHLNVVSLLHVRFSLPYGEALALASPGTVVAVVLVGLLFRQRWHAGYSKLASQLPAHGVGR
jgi:hypothetical protein